VSNLVIHKFRVGLTTLSVVGLLAGCSSNDSQPREPVTATTPVAGAAASPPVATASSPTTSSNGISSAQGVVDAIRAADAGCDTSQETSFDGPTSSMECEISADGSTRELGITTWANITARDAFVDSTSGSYGSCFVIGPNWLVDTGSSKTRAASLNEVLGGRVQCPD